MPDVVRVRAYGSVLHCGVVVVRSRVRTTTRPSLNSADAQMVSMWPLNTARWAAVRFVAAPLMLR